MILPIMEGGTTNGNAKLESHHFTSFTHIYPDSTRAFVFLMSLVLIQ
jgi:hypothetical protein